MHSNIWNITTVLYSKMCTAYYYTWVVLYNGADRVERYNIMYVCIPNLSSIPRVRLALDLIVLV